MGNLASSLSVVTLTKHVILCDVLFSLATAQTDANNIGFCGFVAATNINVAIRRYFKNVDSSEWSCNSNGGTNSNPCYDADDNYSGGGGGGWYGVSCEGSNVVTYLDLELLGITGKKCHCTLCTTGSVFLH